MKVFINHIEYDIKVIYNENWWTLEATECLSFLQIEDKVKPRKANCREETFERAFCALALNLGLKFKY